MKPRTPSIGDYVLGTRWSDGDPGDPWAVGFLTAVHCTPLGQRFIVSHADGTPIRPAGYKHVRRLSFERGKWLLDNSRIIEDSGRKLGFWLRYPMNKEKPA